MSIDINTGRILMAIVLAVVYWAVFRFYKRVSRRCRKKKCGCLRVKRIHKIMLPPDEGVSLRSPDKKLRWFVRRVVKLTFTQCPRCRWTELVKVDTDPISVWHLYWAKLHHRDQFELEDFTLIEAATRRLRKLYHEDGGRRGVERGDDASIDGNTTDTPPLGPTQALQDLFEELFQDDNNGQG